MLRALMLTTLAAVLSAAPSGQELGVLRVRVTLSDATRAAAPVPRHALLISDNPSTSAPRRVVTGADGTIEVRLRPGSYTVESDEPVAFNGKGYQWTQTITVGAGRDVVLELTAQNAEVGDAPAASTPTADTKTADPSLVLSEWGSSVVSVWTPASRASGFLVNAAALVLTSQRAIGNASVVEVQLTESIKVAARVLVADRGRDVAVLWIDPSSAAAVRPVPLDCANGSAVPFASGQRFAAIGAPLRGPKEVSLGDVVRVDQHAAVADFRLAPGSLGGPVFAAGGTLAGLSSTVDGEDERARRDARVVPVADACAAVAAAEKAMQSAPRPVATHLPVEPLQPFPAAALAAAPPRGEAAQSLYRMSSANFDVTFLTPPLIYGAQHSTQQTNRPSDFGEWSDYFADGPAVLAVRVTPKLAESFWTTVARGAAYTQGVALPPIKHFKPGFSRLRAFCGDVEVFPIHPFTLERRVSESDAVREGLYVFEPEALTPHCQSVKLGFYSEKEPDKQDTRPVDPQLIERIWQDFVPSRP